MIHSFLLIGQSNMAGRGFIGEVEPIENEHIKVLRNGRWQPMYVPVNGDRKSSGISLAESFADAYSGEHSVDVGLIPCADGGTNLQQWREGGLLFEHAVYQARLAQRTSVIAGVLWHQGESDCGEEDYPLYEERCTEILCAFRRRLSLEDVPFLLGGLGDFLKELNHPAISKNYIKINQALQHMVQKDDLMAFVSAEGLSGNPDRLHFCSASLREFGLRYYKAFKQLEKTDRVFEQKEEDMVRGELEQL